MYVRVVLTSHKYDLASGVMVVIATVTKKTIYEVSCSPKSAKIEENFFLKKDIQSLSNYFVNPPKKILKLKDIVDLQLNVITNMNARKLRMVFS